ncbi:TonB family protein [Chitinophaga terrae (ex Kim and Jung 2007)]|uniref:M56 family metallopeptidase n=1 Tax=Chitinophaga terrae (ex Kim and Jung 2007) TaxID=408074 RepID=UPI002784790F|nr:M56 family metallopeptidase [Chitinophaga terrae (ex Kim and Jung 2007)]MDQ0108554.1 TonB family protein [Chitinophaga terrae (ex Kim and Jung 2007)]
MNTLSLYLVKMIACSAVLYGYYHLALRNNKFHQWNRYYLVLITLFSLIIPFIKIPFYESESTALFSYNANAAFSVSSTNPAPSATGAGYPEIFMLLGIGVSLALIARLLLTVLQLKQLIKRSTVIDIPPYHLVKNQQINTPFSFFKYIFWDQQTSPESQEGQQILRHELVHIEEKHSTDKLFMEFITSLLWFNPFFHLIKRELALVHEFLADKKAAGKEVASYAQTILQMTFNSKQFNIVNSFFHSPIKRRLLMLTKFQHSRFSYLRRVLVLPLTATIFFIFACESKDKTRDAISPAASVQEQVDELPVFKGGQSALADYLKKEINYPQAAKDKDMKGVVNVEFVVEKDGKISNPRIIGNDPGYGMGQEALRAVGAMPLWNPAKLKGQPVATKMKLPIIFAPSKIFTFVETPPEFPGGEEGLALFLNKNIRYPKAAQEAGTFGTVFIQFTVSKDGIVYDVKTVGKRHGNGLEEEAIRVAKLMPKWNPGRHNNEAVDVVFNLPIRFTLQE